jgi:hypothetical protein
MPFLGLAKRAEHDYFVIEALSEPCAKRYVLVFKSSFYANYTPLFTSTIVASIPRKQKHRFFEPKKQDSTITLTIMITIHC